MKVKDDEVRGWNRRNGPYHTETLGVCGNLAGKYDAIGRY